MPENNNLTSAGMYTPEDVKSVIGEVFSGAKTGVELSNEQINNISDALESASDPGVIDIRDYKNSVGVNPDAELESVKVDLPDDPNPIDLIAADIENMTDEDILDPMDDEKTVEQTVEKTKDDFNLTDEEAMELLQTLSKMKEDPKYPVFYHIPEKMRQIVRELASGANVGANHYNEIARMVLSEMVGTTGINNAMIDLEESLNKALAIPSISDIYSEHTREVMEVHIPETIEKIKDEYPEKAATLQKVKDAFTASYNFSFAKEEYLNNSRIRKAVRRQDVELKRTLNDFNGMNEKSKFKMNDVSELPVILYKVLIDKPMEGNSLPEYASRNLEYYLNPEKYQKDLEAEMEEHKDEEDYTITTKPYNPHIDWIPFYEKYDMDTKAKFVGYMSINSIPKDTKDITNATKVMITKADIDKFCTMIAKTCMNKDPLSVVDASYMYYMMRNIIMLKHTQEAKTDFAAELISNIIETISFINNEEAKFYANNKQHTQPAIHSNRNGKS